MFQVCLPLLALWSITSFASAVTLTCKPKEFSIELDNGKIVDYENPVFTFVYNRNNLAVHQYPGTPSVNLYFPKSQVSFKGKAKYPEFNVARKKSINTETIGLANTEKSDNGNTLKDCSFGMLKISNKGKNLSEILENRIFEEISNCIQTQLCQDLGIIDNDDVSRADIKRNFGPMDVRDRSIAVTHPEIIPPRTQSRPINKITTIAPRVQNGGESNYGIASSSATNKNQNKRVNIIEGVDSIINGVGRLYKYFNSGFIPIPNIVDGLLTKASSGVFGDLTRLQRVHPSRSPVRERQINENQKVVSFTFGLSETHAVYAQYEPVPIISLGFKYSVTTTITNLEFVATILMDFSENVCRTSFINFDVTNKGTVVRNDISIGNNILELFASAWHNDIYLVVATNIANTMAAYFTRGYFDCENYRPVQNS